MSLVPPVAGYQRVNSVNDYPAVVWGKDIRKTYGRGSSTINVLNGLNITVPRGSIYGLLGPSGCGKTTFLRIVIGRLSHNSGHIIVLGDKPGAKGHKVPGSMVGYMPQETALFPDLTIAETLKYFGHLHGMSSELIRTRTDFLMEFFTLPDKYRLVNQLSGGQMRRVSFMVALLHEPELLIVDEPTVGVDPLLRERIWDHLVNISSHTHNQTTIILTTHYIEEARKADKVGFMRNGRILTEDKPMRILQSFKQDSLENVFLQLCHEDRDGTPADLAEPRDEDPFAGDCTENRLAGDDDDVPLIDIQEPPHVAHSGCLSNVRLGFPSGRNIAAQFIKNIILMRRNIGFLLFQFLLPIVQIVLFCECIGRNPFDLHMAVVNQDSGILGLNLGQQLLSAINPHVITQDDYSHRSYSEAYQSVKDTKTWGIISIGANFSQDLFLRFLGGSNVSESVINGSTVFLNLDESNQQVVGVVQKTILEAFETFSAALLVNHSMNPKLTSLPVMVKEPIYGDLDASFTSYLAPGVIISSTIGSKKSRLEELRYVWAKFPGLPYWPVQVVDKEEDKYIVYVKSDHAHITFFLATGLTTLVFVMDKKSGMFDRCLASGMVSFEIMLAHMFTQMLVVIVQVSALLVFVLIVFHVECKGPLVWVILLVLLQGFCGMALGVLYAAICDEENSAIQLALGSFFPILLISGIIWPLEAIPMWLRYISYCSPLTFASEAMRCILSRGLDITFFAVWRGYLVSSGWCLALVIIGGIVLRLKE